VPPSWGQAGAFQNLFFLSLADNQLTGPLPCSWPLTLQELILSNNRLHGTIPAGLSAMKQLHILEIDHNSLTGQLPLDWGLVDAWPQRGFLYCSANHISGTLPSSWSNPGAFHTLTLLYLDDNDITGTLPQSWAFSSCFSRLQDLLLGNTGLSGTLPVGWTAPNAFATLQQLDLHSTHLQGSVPSFNNINLTILSLDSCSFNSSLDELWTSSAPLKIINLSNNSLSGSLPDNAGALDHLISLDLSQNRLEGPVPLSWLQADGFLSHVSFLNVGSVWQGSVALTSWRQQLCLKKNLYDTDVTGQSLALLPTLAQSLPDAQLVNENYADEVQFSKKDVYTALIREFSFQVRDGLQFSNNQLASVRDICANHGSRKVLLIAWLVFGACCLTVVAVYICAQCVLKGHDSVKSKVNLLAKCPAFWATSGQVYRTFSGLGMLAFYYYDLVTSIVVLAQVWGTWPGGVLMTIFLVHFATTGAVVLFHGLYKFAGLKNHLSGPQLFTFILGAAVVFSPLMIPIVLVLDTLAFVRQVFNCAKQLAGLSGFRWSRPRNLAAVVCFGSLHRCHYFGLQWVDLEGYESMHNLIAAVLQSVPTVILNSVLFSLGNKPSHGLFLSNTLFVAAIAASCLAILKCLIVVLWQAFRSCVNPIRLAVSLILGQTLAGIENNSQASDNSTQVGSIALLVRQYELSGSARLGAPV